MTSVLTPTPTTLAVFLVAPVTTPSPLRTPLEHHRRLFSAGYAEWWCRNDTFTVGSNLDVISANTTMTAGNMVINDADVFDGGSTLATTQSNWAAGSVYNLSAAAALSVVAEVAGTLNGIGDVAVWSDNTDSYLAIQTLATNTHSSMFIIKIDGKDLTTTTLFGAQALRASNFGFDVTYSTSTNGLKITLT